ncbi:MULTISPECIES: cupin domain-containing protein [Myxococcaceae]|uniref:cupin domain-containing protein n=1 Tax=Myxococcaceae TaxID=31 RepID=UPI001E513633|nr:MULTISPECIES: cupin domain-containing protein [Myxococcaceae]
MAFALATSATAQAPAGEQRRTLEEYRAQASGGPGRGTSGVAGIQTTVLKGDPAKAGLYTLLLRVPPHTRIAAHSHSDDRVGTVVSGTWYFGYGRTFDAQALRALPPGSFYTEPPDDAHFAETRDSEVLVLLSGVGPSETTYVRPEDAPH